MRWTGTRRNLRWLRLLDVKKPLIQIDIATSEVHSSFG